MARGGATISRPNATPKQSIVTGRSYSRWYFNCSYGSLIISALHNCFCKALVSPKSGTAGSCFAERRKFKVIYNGLPNEPYRLRIQREGFRNKSDADAALMNIHLKQHGSWLLNSRYSKYLVYRKWPGWGILHSGSWPCVYIHALIIPSDKINFISHDPRNRRWSNYFIQLLCPTYATPMNCQYSQQKNKQKG